MSKTYLDKIYGVEGEAAQRALYDDWAGSYDAELGENAYQTPGRVAAALKQALAGEAKAARILDFACGTGLSGAALHAQGFTEIDGCDVSQGMLDVAKDKQVYGALIKTPLGPPPPELIAGYDAVIAVGAISPGAAPASCLTAIMDALSPGARLAVSYNELALKEDGYKAALDAVLARPDVRLESSEDGPHIQELGSISRVMVLLKL